MKRYTSYKDSGVEWLGEIPEHWQVMPAFSVFKEQCLRNKNLVEKNLLSLSYGRIIKKDFESNYGLLPESFETYQIVNPGNIILRLTDLQNDKKSLRVGIVKEKGIITSAYLCLNTQHIYAQYAYKLLHNYDILKVFYNMGSGIRQNMNFKDLKRLPILVPPPEEQKAIAHFLDHKLEQIEQYIRNKKQLIELLNEQKTAIINRAVTKGINPNAPMKHSGIEWLGEIPAHWEVKKLKYVKNSEPNSFVDGPFGSNLKSIHYIKDGAVYVVESGFITSGKFILKDFKTISREHFETIKRSSCKGGDIIISKIGANFGMSGILPELNREAVISGNSLKLTINLRLYDTKYIHYHLLSLKHGGTFDLIVNATAQPALSLGTMNNIAVVIPPIYEQQAIVSFIEQESAKIDLAIAQIEKEIELIQEYRTTLISDAVTGKIDVRELSRR